MKEATDGLNAAQRAAVTSPAAVLQVLAPPGSGKTKTLTARVAYLISNTKLNPRNIIVCTFTIKAAKEMRERIETLLGADISKQLLLGTYHSIARRFLSAHGHLIGLPPKFGIADTSDSKNIVKRVIKTFQLTIDPNLARSRISSLKAKGTSPEQYAVLSRSSKEGAVAEEITQVYSAYEEELKQSSLLDYDDLLVRCEELLRRHPSCVSRIEAVLVDEFQDTNFIQFELMCRFAQERNVISTVGDPDQSIYGWRSADITNLRKMRDRYPDTHVVNLEENYRSSGMILFTAQDVIDQDESRPQKSLVPTHGLGISPVLRKLPSADAEAKWIVMETMRSYTLLAGLLNYNDYAILLRSASLSLRIESQLGKAGIPYRMVGGHRFFDRVEVKLVLDYLRVIDQPDNAEALSRVINVPPRRIGDVTVNGLLSEASERKMRLWDLVRSIAKGNLKSRTKINAQALKGIEKFHHIIESSRKKLKDPSEESLLDFVEWLLRKIDLRSYLQSKHEQESFESRWAYVEELTAQVNGLAAQEDRNLADDATEDSGNTQIDEPREEARALQLSTFLGNVALATEKQDANEENNKMGHVTISTIHAAKGLEWPVVFIPSAYEGSIPHSRAEDQDEERRLLYVAMTRAQSLLYIIQPLEDTSGRTTKLSPFLDGDRLHTRFLQRGTRLDVQVAKDLACILRRKCPEAPAIDMARTRAFKIDDDLWKLKDGIVELEDKEVVEAALGRSRSLKRKSDEFEADGMIQPWQKHRLVDNDRSGASFRSSSSLMISTSMSQRAEFSVSSANFSSGFTSAATLARNSPPIPRDRPAFHERKASRQVASQEDTNIRNAALARPGQANITTFFSRQNNVIRDGRQEPTELSRSSEILSIQAQSTPTMPLADITATLTNVDRDLSLATSRPAIMKPPSNAISVLLGETSGPRRRTLGVRRSLNGWPPSTRR